MAENRDADRKDAAGSGEKRKTDRVIIVEGKYDKCKLASFIDGIIIVTNGFEIYKNKETQAFIKEMAEQRGIVILTDSDKSGFKIRSFILGCVPKADVINVFIPDVFGKERRKTQFSKEGKIGVEGIKKEILLTALSDAGIFGGTLNKKEPISKAQLYELGLSGREQSAYLRGWLKEKLNLPHNLSANLLLQVLNMRYSFEELQEMMKGDIDGNG